jgi:hypothetical protein
MSRQEHTARLCAECSSRTRRGEKHEGSGESLHFRGPHVSISGPAAARMVSPTGGQGINSIAVTASRPEPRTPPRPQWLRAAGQTACLRCGPGRQSRSAVRPGRRPRARPPGLAVPSRWRRPSLRFCLARLAGRSSLCPARLSFVLWCSRGRRGCEVRPEPVIPACPNLAVRRRVTMVRGWN